jgi:hypothetical protein
MHQLDIRAGDGEATVRVQRVNTGGERIVIVPIKIHQHRMSKLSIAKARRRSARVKDPQCPARKELAQSLIEEYAGTSE